MKKLPNKPTYEELNSALAWLYDTVLTLHSQEANRTTSGLHQPMKNALKLMKAVEANLEENAFAGVNSTIVK